MGPDDGWGDIVVALFCDQSCIIGIARSVYWQLGINNEYTCGLPFYGKIWYEL